MFQLLSVKFMLFQELGEVNEAFENDSEQRDTDNNISVSNGVATAASTNEKINVVCVLNIN